MCQIIDQYLYFHCFQKFLRDVYLIELSKCNIIIDHQFGFRPKYSTSFALVDFLYNVLNALERKEITIGLFLDLSKAFDSLDHHILLDKLYCLWIQRYCTQMV